MNRISVLVYSVLLLAPALAFAAAPTLKVTKSVDIDAPVEKVWDNVKDFGGLDKWHPALASDKVVEGTDNQVGAVRLLTLKDGGTIKEKLLGYDAGGHVYRYAILEGVLPVSHYTSSIRVTAAGKNKTRVVWTGSFKRKDTGDKPAENANDKTATDTMSGVYQAGLDNLKKMSEAK